MSDLSDANILDFVIATIRRTIDEDWMQDFEITRETRFNDDLELESIEFVKIADRLQAHYGARLDIAGWLSGKSVNELVGLSVGVLADYIERALVSPGAAGRA